MRRRRVLTILILLLAGAVVSVAVAWGSWWVWWSSGPVLGQLKDRRVLWLPTDLASADRAIWARCALDGWPPTPDRVVWEYSAFAVRCRHMIRSVFVSTGFGGFERHEVSAIRCGWPTTSLAIEVRRSPRNVPLPYELIGWNLARDVPLPARPLWSGLLVNTLFYATLLWLLLLGPFALRRFMRVRRGLCPKCAYPMGESEACSECGAELARKATT